MSEAFLIVWAVSVAFVIAAVVQEVVRTRRTRHRTRNLREIAEIARRYGLTVSSGYRTPEEHHRRQSDHRRSVIWPEVRSDHYNHDHTKGLWQTAPSSRFYDPIEMAERVERQAEFYRQYMLNRYGSPPPLATCVHRTPEGIECPWCES